MSDIPYNMFDDGTHDIEGLIFLARKLGIADELHGRLRSVLVEGMVSTVVKWEAVDTTFLMLDPNYKPVCESSGVGQVE